MKQFLLCLIFALSAAHAPGAEEDWRTFTDMEGRTFEGRVVSIDEDEEIVTVITKKTNRTSKVRFQILSESDIDYLKNWEPAEAGADDVEAEDTGKISSRLYPRTKQEIRDGIKEIEKREAPNGIEKDQQKTINELNVYRFLCGVPDEVEADRKMVEQATDAAQACAKNGDLSHGLGHSTDICNLANGSNMFSSVRQYMQDHGENNRANRGHRRWCLNPEMGKTGFGEEGAYSAMVAMDSSGKGRMKDSWAYPGKGFFPKQYLHGNGWTLYLPDGAPEKKDIKVEVYKLSKRPEKAFSANEEIPGTALPVEFVSVYENAINFEPQFEPITDRGTYWVRITGGGLREGYVVELY